MLRYLAKSALAKILPIRQNQHSLKFDWIQSSRSRPKFCLFGPSQNLVVLDHVVPSQNSIICGQILPSQSWPKFVHTRPSRPRLKFVRIWPSRPSKKSNKIYKVGLDQNSADPNQNSAESAMIECQPSSFHVEIWSSWPREKICQIQLCRS